MYSVSYRTVFKHLAIVRPRLSADTAQTSQSRWVVIVFFLGADTEPLKRGFHPKQRTQRPFLLLRFGRCVLLRKLRRPTFLRQLRLLRTFRRSLCMLCWVETGLKPGFPAELQ